MLLNPFKCIEDHFYALIYYSLPRLMAKQEARVSMQWVLLIDDDVVFDQASFSQTCIIVLLCLGSFVQSIIPGKFTSSDNILLALTCTIASNTNVSKIQIQEQKQKNPKVERVVLSKPENTARKVTQKCEVEWVFVKEDIKKDHGHNVNTICCQNSP